MRACRHASLPLLHPILFSYPCHAPFARQPRCSQLACARGASTSIQPRPCARTTVPRACIHVTTSIPTSYPPRIPPLLLHRGFPYLFQLFSPEFNLQVKFLREVGQARRDEAHRATRWLHLRRHACAFRRKRGDPFLARPQRRRAAKNRSPGLPSEPRKRRNCRCWSNQGLD